MRGVVGLIVATSLAVMTVSLRGAYSAVDRLCQNLIEQTTSRTHTEIDRLTRPVIQILQAARAWGHAGELSLDKTRELNARFMPILEQTPVSSMLIANTRGEEYMLLELGEEWRNRLVNKADWGERTHWLKWSRAPKLKGEWDKVLDYDPRKRPWFTGALASSGGSPHFTQPYTFFTTKDPGITASLKYRPAKDAPEHVIAFDIMLIDLSRFTTGLNVSPHGQLAVLSEDGRVLGLPNQERFKSLSGIKKNILKTPEELQLTPVGQILEHFRSHGSGPFSFQQTRDRFWGGIQTIALGEDRKLLIAVAVPESDLLGEAKTQRNQTILILVLGLAGALLVLGLLDRAVRRDVDRAVKQARKLGQYTLVRKLGEGGMGTVYLARHAMLRRPTAIKLMHRAQAQDEQSLIRFEREVQLTSSLTHPNTIAIYDYGRTQEHEFYYAMEYLEGLTLQRLVEIFGTVPASRVLFILQQVCGSLNEAHAAGLTHRDIKPANIMLCQRGGLSDVVKVLDFGLVKPQTANQDSMVTRTNVLTGTPLYMAPEMITNPTEVDGRTDVYSLGVVAYFLLTGQPVFVGNSALEVCSQHLHNAPSPPSELEPGVPKDVDALVLSCLEKKPKDRPSSAQQLLERVNACADAGRWSSKQAAAWWDEHRDALKESGASLQPIKDTSLLTVELHEQPS